MQLRSGKTVYRSPVVDLFNTCNNKNTVDDKRQCILKMKSFLGVIEHFNVKTDMSNTIADKNTYSNLKLATIIEFWEFMLTEEAKTHIMSQHKQFCNLIRSQCDKIEKELKMQAGSTLQRAVLIANFIDKNKMLKNYIDSLWG